MKINFKYEKDTKNTVRFAEADPTEQAEGHPGYNVVGTLYVQKAAYVALGNPQNVTVEILPVA